MLLESFLSVFLFPLAWTWSKFPNDKQFLQSYPVFELLLSFNVNHSFVDCGYSIDMLQKLELISDKNTWSSEQVLQNAFLSIWILVMCN